MTNFDAAARTWDQDPAKVERARAIAAAILNRIPIHKNTRALEYGAGTGLLGFALQPHVGDMVLADTSPGMLTVAQEKINARSVTNMRILALDLEKDPPPGQKFDLILTMMTLHHIADTASILNKFYALLNTDGHLCVADLDQEDGSFHGSGFTGHFGFDRSELAGMAQSAGFTNVRFDTAFHMQKRVVDTMRTFPMFLMTAKRTAM